MYSFFAKVKRPLLAMALIIGIGAGVAKASESFFIDSYGNRQYISSGYGYNTMAVMPVSSDAYCGSACGTACPAPEVSCSPCAPAPAAPVCNPCGAAANMNRTNLPGVYSNDYNYSMSSQAPGAMGYIIPTQTGLLESPTIPLTNPVDRYYATHKVINGEVVDVGHDNHNFSVQNDAMSLAQYVQDITNNPSLAQGTVVFDNNANPITSASMANTGSNMQINGTPVVPTSASATATNAVNRMNDNMNSMNKAMNTMNENMNTLNNAARNASNVADQNFNNFTNPSNVTNTSTTPSNSNTSNQPITYQ